MDPRMKHSLDKIFNPESIAVIGASNNPSTWGYRTLGSIVGGKYRKKIYPIHPKEKVIQGLTAYARISDVPDTVDLAIIVIKAELVTGVIRECIEKGIKGGIVITAGFAEISGEGAAHQKKLVKECDEAGFHFIGPNCLGVVSTDANLCTMFREGMDPPKGPISFISQSGTLGWDFYHASLKSGFGMNKLISCGNQASISFVDLLEYLGQDPSTSVITGYMEDVRDGRRFLETARAITPHKPIFLFKAGGDEASARAAKSHTAALAGNDEVFEAACHQAGVIRWHDVNEMFDMADAACYLPRPKGNRVAVVSDGGGFNVTTAQACSRMGLNLPEMSQKAQAEILQHMQPFSPEPLNPIDCIAAKNDMAYRKIIEIAAAQDYIDGLIVMPFMGSFDRSQTPQRMIELIEFAESIATIPERHHKPVVLIADHNASGPVFEIFKRHHIPVLESPNDCARTMYGIMKYTEIAGMACSNI